MTNLTVIGGGDGIAAAPLPAGKPALGLLGFHFDGFVKKRWWKVFVRTAANDELHLGPFGKQAELRLASSTYEIMVVSGDGAAAGRQWLARDG